MNTLTTTLTDAAGPAVEVGYEYHAPIAGDRAFGSPDRAAPPQRATADILWVRVIEKGNIEPALADIEIDRLEGLALAAEAQAVEVGAE